MPGPKMGPRPPDFDEQVVRQSPTFQKWLSLDLGQRLKYACREFIKGHKDDEERLMRRIMIARRNNIRDHETLKKARKIKRPQSGSGGGGGGGGDNNTNNKNHNSNKRQKRNLYSLADHIVEREMDVVAVELTRSYKKWMALPEGGEFVYNQTYTKGKEGQDWLLKKNIWRRMRYRRENKKMVEKLKTEDPNAVMESADSEDLSIGGSGTGDSRFHQHQHHHQQHSEDLTNPHHRNNRVLFPSMGLATANSADDAVAAAAAVASVQFADQAAIDAAVAAAESFGNVSSDQTHHHHHDIHHHHHHVDDPTGAAMEMTHPHHYYRRQPGTAENSSLIVHDPLQAAAAQAALDAAARLAAVSHPEGLHHHHHHHHDGHHEPLHHHEDVGEGDVDVDDDVTERLLMRDDDVGDISAMV